MALDQLRMPLAHMVGRNIARKHERRPAHRQVVPVCRACFSSRIWTLAQMLCVLAS